MAAVFNLSERLTIWRVTGLIPGFTGVVLLVWPDPGGTAPNRVRSIGIALGSASTTQSGLYGGFAPVALTLSFRYTGASRIAPFEYIALLPPLMANLPIFRLSLSTSFLLAPLVLAGAAVAAMEGMSKVRKRSILPNR